MPGNADGAVMRETRSGNKRETGIEPVTIRAAIEHSTTDLPVHTHLHAHCTYHINTTYPPLRLPRRVLSYREHSHYMFSWSQLDTTQFI